MVGRGAPAQIYLLFSGQFHQGFPFRTVAHQQQPAGQAADGPDQMIDPLVFCQGANITYQRFAVRGEFPMQCRRFPGREGFGVHPMGDNLQNSPVALAQQHIAGHAIAHQDGIGPLEHITLHPVEGRWIMLELVLRCMQHNLTARGITPAVPHHLKAAGIERFVLQIDNVRLKPL